MPQVHSSAIVDSSVHLADDVVIGPGCVVQGEVRIGSGTQLLHNVYIRGPVTIGARNTLYPNVCIGYPPQHRGVAPDAPTSGVRIGDDNVLREGVTLHTATKETPTSIGDRNYLMVNSHLGHDARIDHDVTMANGALLGGHVHVADRAFIGGSAGIHQFVRIGRLAMIGGLCPAIQDVPPFCVIHESRGVGSLNLVGLRRAGLRHHIEALKEAFRITFREHHVTPRAAELIEKRLSDDMLCMEWAKFLRETKRGIAHYHRGRSSG